MVFQSRPYIAVIPTSEFLAMAYTFTPIYISKLMAKFGGNLAQRFGVSLVDVFAKLLKIVAKHHRS